jgi:hypothetical protein
MDINIEGEAVQHGRNLAQADALPMRPNGK